ncbi:MAG: 50S ribosomal protein L25 [Candidatus Paceibacterota bacterium]
MLKLKASTRDKFGKKIKASREAGLLPVVVYGRKEESKPFFVAVKDFEKVLKEAGESTVVDLMCPEGDKSVLIYAVDYHPVSGLPIHADFYAVEKDKKVEVDVELVFVGESPAVKGLNGILVKVIHALTIEAKPADLPHDIKVDISSLVDFDSQITVADLNLPTGVTSLIPAEEVVALVSAPKEEEPEEATEAPDLSNIEAEKKGKKEEEAPADDKS